MQTATGIGPITDAYGMETATAPTNGNSEMLRTVDGAVIPWGGAQTGTVCDQTPCYYTLVSPRPGTP